MLNFSLLTLADLDQVVRLLSLFVWLEQAEGDGLLLPELDGILALELPELSTDTIDRLSDHVPHTGSINNPVDFTFTKSWRSFYSDIPSVLIEDENVDILLVYLTLSQIGVQTALERAGLPEHRQSSLPAACYRG